VTIQIFTGTLTDAAGHQASQDVAVNVDSLAPPSWGPKILEWIQPLPDSTGAIIMANPGDWQAKANALLPGQSLYLTAGEYGARGSTFSWTRAGIATAPITISGIPGDPKPIIRGKINLNGPYQRWSHSIFDGPTGPTGGPGPNGESILVNLQGNELELSDCEMRYDYWHAGIGANAAISKYRILNCYIHDNGGYLGDYTDAQSNTSHGLYLSPSYYGLIANCVIEHNDAKGLMGRHDSHNLMIVHNTIVANGRKGSEAYEQTHDWTWANNIFLNNGNVKGGEGLSMAGIGPGFLNRRNVFWHNNGPSLTDEWAGVGTTSEPLVADPKCVRPAVYTPHQDPAPDWDHHLMSTSPAIGYGDPDYAMPFDFDGKPRGTSPDCGAFQH